MDRRDFLATSMSASALALLGSAPVRADGIDVAAPAIGARRITLNMTTPWSRSPSGYFDRAFALARRIEALSGGTFEIALEPAGLETKRADLSFGFEHDRVALHPGFAYFAGLPGERGLTPRVHRAWLSDGGGQALWDDLSAPFGLKPLLAGHTGERPPLALTFAPREPRDFNGRPMFARGLSADLLRALGARVSVTSETEVEALLRTPEGLEGCEWGGPLDMPAQTPNRFSFHAPGALSTGGSVLALSVSRAVWDRLGFEQQSILKAAADAAFDEALAVSETLAPWLSARGVSTIKGQTALLPPAVRRTIARISDTLIAHASAHDARARRIDISFQRFAAGQPETA